MTAARVCAAVVIAAFGGLGLVWLGSLLMSCGGTVNEVAQYAAEQQQCVLTASSRDASDQCRAISKEKWEAKWCEEYPDAGMWSCTGGDQ